MAKSKEVFCETKTVNIEGKEMDLIRFHGDTSYKIHNWERAAVRDHSGGRVRRQKRVS